MVVMGIIATAALLTPVAMVLGYILVDGWKGLE